ncbi:MAG: TRAP transporter small permease [Synergistaceae bacterium]|jgi:TRAP-type C4-dicarboxylate transport system permease small subunit|nr:TRAP transporter small permease [Synergistaceae bacterium]
MPEGPRKNALDRILVSFFAFILILNSLGITLLITGAASARYVFKVNFYGYDEIAVLVAFWFYFMGAAYGSYNNSHVTADIVDAYIPMGKTRRALTFARWLLACAACGIFVYYGFGYFKFSFMGPLGNFQFIPKSMVWRIPLWTSHLAIFSGLIFMEIYFLRNLILSTRAIVRGEGEA